MQGVGKIASLLLTSAVACTLLAGCHGSSTSVASTSPPTVGTFLCPVVPNLTPTTTPGISVACTSTGAISADNSAVTYNWNFGDQTLANSTQATTGNPVTHYYAQPGNYQVSLTVVDDHGTSASRVQTINVPAPTATNPNSSVPANGVENWAWIGDSKYANSPGDYQTQFVASPLNQPSARQNAASWTSPQGMLWMFGGAGDDSNGTVGVLNDLWMYNPSTSQWTWVSGSSKVNSTGTFPANTGITAATNVISARSAMASWVDASGNFWLFGGSGIDKNGNTSYLNDLWSLNQQTGEATWESGTGIGNSISVVGTQGVPSTANSPAGRAYAASWTDKTNVFYLFGGESVTSTGTPVFFDDLWSYDPNPVSPTHPNGQKGWILVSASTTATAVNQIGVYGTAGTPAQANTPGARISAQTWVDSAGNLWLFGGEGFDANNLLGPLNDLWVYSNQKWTWVSGSSTEGAVSTYGTKGSTVAASSTLPNTPGARLGTSGWVDPATGYLWMFGGSGSDSTSTTTANDGGGALNELWVFIPNAQATGGQWAWMGGVNIEGTAGVYVNPTPAPYASQPDASAASSNYNTPGSRVWGISWFVPGIVTNGTTNNFYLFGGTGLDSVGTSGYLNDLWTVQNNVPPKTK